MIPRKIGRPSLPISVPELRRHLRLSFDIATDSPIDSPYAFPEDEDLARVLGAAVTYAENYTGQTIARQRFEGALHRFPSGWPMGMGCRIPITSPYWTNPSAVGYCHRNDFIEIGSPPLISFESLVYTDADGVTQVLPADQYVIDAYSASRPRVYPNFGTSWPETNSGSPVWMRWTGGYESQSDSPIDSPVDSPWADSQGLPDDLRSAILMIAGDLWANRESLVVETRVTPAMLPWGVVQLLQPYRLDVGL